MRWLLAWLILATLGWCVQLDAQTTRDVDLSWTASTTTQVTGYNVQRSTSTSGPFTILNTALIAGTSYVDATAVVGSTYTYEVIAVAPACTPTSTTPCGSSAPSAPATTAVPAQPVAVVTVTIAIP